jgi:hypothetical protein
MAPLLNAASELNQEDDCLNLSWRDNPYAKKLLDALVSILVEEYIQIAKQNPEIFSN